MSVAENTADFNKAIFDLIILVQVLHNEHINEVAYVLYRRNL